MRDSMSERPRCLGQESSRSQQAGAGARRCQDWRARSRTHRPRRRTARVTQYRRGHTTGWVILLLDTAQERKPSAGGAFRNGK